MNIIKDITSFYNKNKIKAIVLFSAILIGLVFARTATFALLVIYFFYYLWSKRKIKTTDAENTKELCPHCKTEVSSEASRCPHCQGKIYRWTTGRKILAGLVVFIVIGIIFSGGSDNKNSTSSSSNNVPSAPIENSASVEEAKKELDDFISLGMKANLITSYEFSDSASVVYIDSVWYTQTVQFKKDFIAKIGMLKKTITGYSHFEVRDTYSNEKVGEITAFSSSIEVYK